MSAPKVTPTGTVEVTVKGALQEEDLDADAQAGSARRSSVLPKARKVGNIKVKVEYLGDAAVLGSKDRLKIRVAKK